MTTPSFKLLRAGSPWLLAAVVGLACSALQAQTKLAVVNYTNVFAGYWKTKQARVQLNDRIADFDKARKGLVDDYQKANEDYRKLIESASDQAVSPDERDKRKKTAESKLLEIKEIETSINTFDNNAKSTLGQQQQRMTDNIARDVRDAISTKAKKASYNLILDSSALGVSGSPVILFANGLPDISEEIITELNAQAPTGALATPDKPDDAGKDTKGDSKPAEKK